ncbi:hypothetical protein DFH08DRAFT_859801 [Mycena albidolilacea]|uniref:Uncharacterized protein n=1 Tax=Mycena albidolilacea TaxID=1033008 RepID=A0AAD7A799_9AGAR|nr:hypothetical protein DFH08DRAFT_859801 [Mycena albidolilacea]
MQRQATYNALSEARASALNASLKLEAEITTLRKENAALKEDAAILQRVREEESDEELNLQEEYDALKITHRELKHAYSERRPHRRNWSQMLPCTNRLRLNLHMRYEPRSEFNPPKYDIYRPGPQKAAVDGALRDLRVQYDALKTKKTRKNNKNSQEVEAALNADMNRLTEDLAAANKRAKSSAQAYSKLDTLYNEELEFLQRYDKLVATNKEFTNKCFALEKGNSTFKATCNELEARNLKLDQEYRALWTRRNEIEKICTEAVRATQKTNEEATEFKDTIHALRIESRAQEDRLEQARTVNQAFRNRIQSGRVSTAVARILYDDFMRTLPSIIPGRPDFYSLQPVAKIEVSLAEYLTADQVCAGYLNSAFYFPGRTVWSSPERLHILAFTPTHKYNMRGTWTESSDILDLINLRREVFIEVHESIYYVGTYRLHDLRYLCPGGTQPPETVASLDMLNAAGLGTLPPEQQTQVINRSFPRGGLDADCMGLECIGFNRTLYDTLLRRRSGIKREAGDVGLEALGTDIKRRRSDIALIPSVAALDS